METNVVTSLQPKPSEPKAETGEPTDAPHRYINRELSLLQFNRRVLAQARDTRVPLLERLRFLTICSSNLDEFFEIRVSGVKQQIAMGVTESGIDATTPDDVMRRIADQTHKIVDEQYRVLNEELLPELAQEGVQLIQPDQTSDVVTWARRYFMKEVLPVLTPVGLDPAHPFPQILNKSLNFLISLEGKDAFGRMTEYAVVQAPRALPRLIRVPEDVMDGAYNIVLLTSLIRYFVAELFPGMTILASYPFRVTRNSDLYIDEDGADDLLDALAGELSSRSYGDAVRLEVAAGCPNETVQFLTTHFGLEECDVYRVGGPVNLNRLSAVYGMVERPTLKYAPFVSASESGLGSQGDIFEVLRLRSVLMHHPYQAFTPVVNLVRRAASDKDVLAIKMTLYRTGSDSPLVQALIDAARQGTDVTVVVELRARFDEAANIDLATRLQGVGANVVYGVVGYKAHAKMLMIVRREGRELRRYVHLGTGNYHSGTAKAYTDWGLMSSDSELGEDMNRTFQMLTGLGKAAKLSKFLVAPFTLHQALLDMIDFEIGEAKSGRPARVAAKLNSLSEKRVIEKLYEASQAGVQIDLVIRGVCCLRAGIPHLSENIRVRSVIGRFLEHSRVYYFLAAGEHRLYCSSADWMTRNLVRRVEVAFPVEEPELKERVIRESLTLGMEDNEQAWTLLPNGDYDRVPPDTKNPVMSQATLLEEYTSSK